MQAPLPQLPRSCNSKGTNQTKQTSKAEVEQITPSQRLRYIVYCPNLLDDLKERTSSCLCSVHLDLQRHDHLIFAAHCLPELATSILPRIICIEEDVTTWVKHAILRPVVASLRALAWDPDGISGVITHSFPTTMPSISTAIQEGIIPDLLFLRAPMIDDIPGRVEPETLATIELKTPNLFRSHPRELFSKSMQMPDDFEDLMSSDTQNRDNQLCFHTM